MNHDDDQYLSVSNQAYRILIALYKDKTKWNRIFDYFIVYLQDQNFKESFSKSKIYSIEIKSEVKLNQKFIGYFKN